MRNLSSPAPPTIAVVIAARDAGDYLGETMRSLQNQEAKPDEVIFYDDGSQDDSLAVVSRFLGKLKGLKVIEGGESVGIASARNRANRAATSDYLAVLDGDDVFPERAIRCYQGFLEAHPETDLLYADTLVCDQDLERGKRRRYPEFASAQSAIRRTLGSPLVPFKHSSMVYRREAIESLGGYDESLRIKVDVELFLRFHAHDKRVAKLNETTSLHRKHGGQISTDRMGGIRAYRKLMQSYEPDPLVRGLLYSARFPSELLKLLLKG